MSSERPPESLPLRAQMAGKGASFVRDFMQDFEQDKSWGNAMPQMTGKEARARGNPRSSGCWESRTARKGPEAVFQTLTQSGGSGVPGLRPARGRAPFPSGPFSHAYLPSTHRVASRVSTWLPYRWKNRAIALFKARNQKRTVPLPRSGRAFRSAGTRRISRRRRSGATARSRRRPQLPTGRFSVGQRRHEEQKP